MSSDVNPVVPGVPFQPEGGSVREKEIEHAAYEAFKKVCADPAGMQEVKHYIKGRKFTSYRQLIGNIWQVQANLARARGEEVQDHDATMINPERLLSDLQEVNDRLTYIRSQNLVYLHLPASVKDKIKAGVKDFDPNEPRDVAEGFRVVLKMGKDVGIALQALGVLIEAKATQEQVADFIAMFEEGNPQAAAMAEFSFLRLTNPEFNQRSTQLVEIFGEPEIPMRDYNLIIKSQLDDNMLSIIYIMQRAQGYTTDQLERIIEHLEMKSFIDSSVKELDVTIECTTSEMMHKFDHFAVD